MATKANRFSCDENSIAFRLRPRKASSGGVANNQRKEQFWPDPITNLKRDNENSRSRRRKKRSAGASSNVPPAQAKMELPSCPKAPVRKNLPYSFARILSPLPRRGLSYRDSDRPVPFFLSMPVWAGTIGRPLVVGDPLRLRRYRPFLTHLHDSVGPVYRCRRRKRLRSFPGYEFFARFEFTVQMTHRQKIEGVVDE